MTMITETNSLSRSRYPNQMHSDPNISSTAAGTDEDFSARNSCVSATASPGYYSGGETSPYNMSPWNPSSPYSKSPWSRGSPVTPFSEENFPPTGLIGSLVREEGHIYSLAASGELLYTGSDSKNIRVWKNQKEYSGFKSSSGLVKAIVLAGDKIFTGHQDGKIRIWRISPKNPTSYRRAGTLPRLKDLIKSSINPSNYVKVRHSRNSVWIKHYDAVSCMSLDMDSGILYSGSWDKTMKVWRMADYRCLESITAHDDAVNSVVTGYGGLVFTGSADGSVKVWKRETAGKVTKHDLVQTLLKQESAVTVLAINPAAGVVYCGSSDGLVNFWENGKQLAHGGALRGHKLAVLCVAVAGNLVFSGSADKTICVWRREAGAHICLSVLNGHTGPVKCLAAEKDPESTLDEGQYILYSGSLDKSVKIWRVSEQAPDMNMQTFDPSDTSSEPGAASNDGSVSHPRKSSV